MTPSPFELLAAGRYNELVARLRDPAARSSLLREAAAFVGPVSGVPAASPDALLAERQLSIRASGDWSWGLLSAKQRRKLLVRDARLLQGAGKPDKGKAQLGALKRLKGELPNLYEALDVALDEGDLGWLLPLAEHLSPVLQVASEFKEMRQRYAALLEAAQRLDSPRLELLAQLGLERAYYRLCDYDSSISSGLAARGLAIRQGDRKCEASAIHSLANVEFEQGNYCAARELYGQALAVRRELGDRCGEAASLNNLGNVELKQGDHSAARELYGQALTIWCGLGDRDGEAMTLCCLGYVDSLQGKYRGGRELYVEAAFILRGLGNRNGEAMALLSLGIVDYEQGNYSAARELYGQALTIWRGLGMRRGEASALHNLGNVEYAQDNLAAARELYGTALAIQHCIGEQPGEADSLSAIGLVDYRQGNYSAARELYEQSLAIRREIGNKTSIAYSCAYSAALLARLACLREAALALHGAQARAAELILVFDSDDQQVLDSGLARLDAAVAAGEITAEELAQWKAEGEAMSLDELAEFTLAALAEAKNG